MKKEFIEHDEETRNDPLDQNVTFDNAKIHELTKMNSKQRNTLEKFWITWKKYYLNNLTDINNREPEKSKEPRVGEVVLIEENETPRNLWKYGRIRRLKLSKDKISRTCKVILPNRKTIESATNHLYLLEIGGITEEEILDYKLKPSEETKLSKQRISNERASKTKARNFFKVLITKITIVIIYLSLLIKITTSNPMICHGKSKLLWKIPKLRTCHKEPFEKNAMPRRIEATRRII